MTRSVSRLRALLAASILACTAPALASPELDTLFDQAMQRWNLPGMAVGVIEDGEVTYMRTAGELRAGEGDPVTPDTLFKIASNGKAMTTALLARLADQGKLAWDDPVTRHLPDFRMSDDWITEQVQVRDLVIHSSGLGPAAGDLMLWPEPNHFTRELVLQGIEHLPPASSFRTRYNYSNVMYIVAGEVAAAASGHGSYEEALRRELFEPLGLARCRVGEWRLADVGGNVAQPHMQVEGRNRVVSADGEVVQEVPMAAAGGIRCSLRDMLSWMQMWLRPEVHGLVDGEPWLSLAQRRNLWSAHTPMPLGERMREWEGANFYAYGLGWRINDSDGFFRVGHTGTLSGMFSALTLLPQKGTGFILMINGPGGDARTALSQALTAHFTRPGSGLDVNHWADRLERERAEASARPGGQVPDTSDRVAAAPVRLGAWLGEYEDPWFGPVSVCALDDGRVGFSSRRSPRVSGTVMESGGRLFVEWPDLSATAESWLELTGPDAAGRHTLALERVNPSAGSSYSFQDMALVRTGDCPAPGP